MDDTIKSAVSEIDGIVLAVGGDCELISALMRMHEAYANGWAKHKIPDDLLSEYQSIQYRLIYDIETEMDRLEQVMDALRKEE